jgi:hypothetical protein
MKTGYMMNSNHQTLEEKPEHKIKPHVAGQANGVEEFTTIPLSQRQEPPASHIPRPDRTAFVIRFFFFFVDIVKKGLKAVGQVVRYLYSGIVDGEFARGMALQRYRKALLEKHNQVQVPFRPGRPLDLRDIYVPLKIAGVAYHQQIDAYQAVTSYQRIVVVGPPGSGKTMLLKNIAVMYAEERLQNLPDQVVPVLVSLHHLNDTSLSLQQQIVNELERNKVFQAERLVTDMLKKGTLLLLFDGLDEVSRNHRGRIVQQIQELVGTYPACRMVITCREAVYHNEFVDSKARKLEIVEFNDQQIRRFLHSWERDMHQNGVSVEQLMQTLRDQPQILSLARNPLVLTIIAYLYTDTSFVLPHSRAEFYRKATDILLDQWHHERNRYEARYKRLVLQNLALFIQDQSTQHQHGFCIDYRIAVERVKEVLPALNLNTSEAPLVLDEIIERSGLVLLIDGGMSVQFAHVTIQEFFAAAELLSNPRSMFERFRADPEAWRETVKLWCGLANDSTKMIRAIYTVDAITALECLSNAQQVDNALAGKIIDAFKTLLGAQTRKSEAIVRAFGVVASDSSPRGQAVFRFLEETLVTSEKPARRLAAAHALSLTNLPEAATVLTASYALSPEVRAPLVRMGDVAVPALASLSATGLLDTMDDLHAIGTSHAAETLVPLLWNENERVAGRAAWCLAALLNQPHVEKVLRAYPLTGEQRSAEWFDWIWKPFQEPAHSSLPVITGRIAWLLEHASPDTIPAKQVMIDPRLAIPLCSVHAEHELKQLNMLESSEYDWIAWNIQTIHDQISAGNDPSECIEPFIVKTLQMIQANPRRVYLISSLEPRIQFNLLVRLVRGPLPTTSDWINIYRPVTYRYHQSWHYRTILALVGITSLVALGQMAVMTIQMPVTISNMLAAGAAVAVVLGWYFLLQEEITRKPQVLLAGLLGPLSVPFTLHEELTQGNQAIPWSQLLGYLPVMVWSVSIACFTTLALLALLPVPYVALAWLVLVGTCVFLWMIGRRRDRVARNPLRGFVKS